MAKENEGQSIRDYGRRKKRFKRIRRSIMLLIFLALIAVASVYIYRLFNKNYKSFEVMNTIDNVVESNTKYLSYGNSVIKYSRDGATALDKNGNLLWNGSYEMNQPIADVCGNYVVVADAGGKNLQLYDRTGAAGGITTIYNIVKAEVSSKGVVAVLTEDEKNNYISIYDIDGTELADIKTNMAEDGYPIDISLSEDGKKLITSYLSVKSGEPVGITTFYNFGEVGQNWTDRTMGSYLFDNTIVPKIEFVNNEVVCVFKEDSFLIFPYMEEPGDPKEIKLDSRIRSVFYNKSYVGVVLEGSESGSEQLMLYNLEGKKILDKRIEFNYNNIYMADKEIIMYDNNSCIIMKLNGTVKFKGSFDTNIDAIYPINGIDRYFLISGSQITRIALVE